MNYRVSQKKRDRTDMSINQNIYVRSCEWCNHHYYRHIFYQVVPRSINWLNIFEDITTNVNVAADSCLRCNGWIYLFRGWTYRVVPCLTKKKDSDWLFWYQGQPWSVFIFSIFQSKILNFFHSVRKKCIFTFTSEK